MNLFSSESLKAQGVCNSCCANVVVAPVSSCHSGDCNILSLTQRARREFFYGQICKFYNYELWKTKVYEKESDLSDTLPSMLMHPIIHHHTRERSFLYLLFYNIELYIKHYFQYTGTVGMTSWKRKKIYI